MIWESLQMSTPYSMQALLFLRHFETVLVNIMEPRRNCVLYILLNILSDQNIIICIIKVLT